MRYSPNIVITGTPGVGKSTTCEQLVSLSASTSSPLRHLSINTLVKDRGCHEDYDEDLKTYIVDDDKLLDEVEKEIQDGEGHGGWLVDWHACDLFPKSWVDLVVVLRCERTDVLWDRLKARYANVESARRSCSAPEDNFMGIADRLTRCCRDYSEAKLQENLDAEIFGVLAEEAREAFDDGTVVELKSETVEDVDANCERILQWVSTWQEENGSRQNGDKGS